MLFSHEILLPLVPQGSMAADDEVVVREVSNAANRNVHSATAACVWASSVEEPW